MEPVSIPKYIDDPIYLILWPADEMATFVICLVGGIMIGQLIISVAIGLMAVKAYRRFRDNWPDGYVLHAAYWVGLRPSQAITVPNPFIRRFLP